MAVRLIYRGDMNIEEAKKEFELRNTQRWDIREKKASDYANAENIHLNFTQRAKLFEILNPDMSDPSQVALMDAVLKIQRIINLAKQSKGAENESVEDSYMDLLNYVDLSFEQVKKENVTRE